MGAVGLLDTCSDEDTARPFPLRCSRGVVAELDVVDVAKALVPFLLGATRLSVLGFS